MKATREYITTLSKIITNKSGITFQEGKGWAADIVNKVITYNPLDLIDKDHIAVRGLILHESAHVLYTTDGKKSDIEKDYPSMHHVYNAIEDVRIEGLIADTYGDYAKEALIESKYRHVPILEKELVTADPIRLFLVSCILGSVMTQHYPTWPVKKRLTIQDLFNRYTIRNNRVRDVLVTLGAGFAGNSLLNEAVRHLSNTQEVKDFCDTKIFPLIQDWLVKGEQGKPPILSCENHRELANKEAESITSALPPVEEMEALMAPTVQYFSKKLKDVLVENKAERFTGSKRSGKLLSKNAYKVVVGDSRAFSRRTTPDKRDYIFHIVLDESGSMRDDNKAIHTYEAAFLLDRTVKKMGCKTTYTIYDDYTRSEQSIEPYRTISAGGNDDYNVMKEVLSKIDPTHHNIVVSFTDGEVNSDPRPILEEMETMYNTTVIAIGVGLSGYSILQLQRYYKTSVAVSDLDKLPDAVTQVLEGIIHR